MVERDPAAQCGKRADPARQGARAQGTQVVLGLGLVLLTGFGYVQLDEYTNRRYTFLLRLAGATVVAVLLAGWWWLFFHAPG